MMAEARDGSLMIGRRIIHICAPMGAENKRGVEWRGLKKEHFHFEV